MHYSRYACPLQYLVRAIIQSPSLLSVRFAGAITAVLRLDSLRDVKVQYQIAVWAWARLNKLSIPWFKPPVRVTARVARRGREKSGKQFETYVALSMANEPSAHVRVGDTSWDVLEEHQSRLLDEIIPQLDSGRDHASQTIVKHNRMRTVMRMDLADGGAVYVKHYRYERLADRVRFSIAPSYAQREWRALRGVLSKAADIIVPCPVAVSDVRTNGLLRESWLVLEAVPSDGILSDFLARRRLSARERRSLLHGLSELTLRAVNAGIYHMDYHASNVLVSETDGTHRLALVDMHSARIVRRCSRRQTHRMLRQMCASLVRDHLPKEEWQTFLRETLPANQRRDRHLCRLIRAVDRLVNRQWANSTARCIGENEWFARARRGTARFSVLKDFGLDRLVDAVEKHRNHADSETALVLKDGSRGMVLAVRLQDDSVVCVKEVHSSGMRKWLKTVVGKGPGRQAWIAANGLAVRGLPVARPFGYMNERTGFIARTEYVITGFVDGSMPVHQWLESGGYGEYSPQQRRRWICRFAGYVARVHQRGVYQHDFKVDNILVKDMAGGRVEFYMVDLDSVWFTRRISRRRRVKNLAQLAAALPNVVTLTQRLRFMREYVRVAELDWDERDVIETVLDCARSIGGRWHVPGTRSADEE